MVILRIALILVCVFSLSWSVLIFGGPSIIKRLIVSYSDGTVIPSNISVSPTLGINIGRLDYIIGNNFFATPIDGFSRSTEISWSLFDDRPFLALDVGPTVLKDIAVLKNVKIHTPSYKKLDWQDLFLVFKTDQLENEFLGKIEKLHLDGTFNIGSSKMNDINFTAEAYRSEEFFPIWSAGLINGIVEAFDLSLPVSEQVITGSFSASDVLGYQPNFRLANATGTLNLSRDNRNLKAHLQDVDLLDFGGFIKEIVVDVYYDRENIFENAQVDFFEGSVSNNLPSFLDITTKISRTNDEKYKSSISGSLSDYNMSTSGNFLGSVPPSNFQIDFLVDSAVRMITAQSKINFNDVGESQINGSAMMEVTLENLAGIYKCLTLLCDLQDFDVNYEVNVDNEWFKGRSICATPPCNIHAFSHSLRTSNTSKILTILNKSNILSPLSSIYLYSAITSGHKINGGHELKF
jgi:hypothetical protein